LAFVISDGIGVGSFLPQPFLRHHMLNYFHK
jgi:hypothetical protein